jgi:hypothetical protein
MIGFSSRLLSCRVNYYSMDHMQPVQRDKWNHTKYKGQQHSLRRWTTSTGGKMLRKFINKLLKISASKWNRSYRAVGYYKYRPRDKVNTRKLYLFEASKNNLSCTVYICHVFLDLFHTLRSFCTVSVLLRWRSRYSDWLQAGQLRSQNSTLVRVENFHFSKLSRPKSNGYRELFLWG